MPQRRRTPRQQRAKQKVARILDAAHELLLSDGAAGFNTNALAAQAGVGVGSIYEYFPNKQAIAAALIERLSEAETDAMLERFGRVQALPLADAVRVLVAALFELYRDNHALYRQLWAMASAPRQVGHRPGERMVMKQMRQRLEPLATELGIVDLDLTVFTAFHLVESLCERFCADGIDRFGADRCIDEIASAALRYLGLTP